GLFWVAVAELAYSYLLYPVILRVLAWRFGDAPVSDASHIPLVAILVPVHNEEKVIEKKIRNFLAIDYPAEKLSLWIGSDCSTDRTEVIVRSCDDPRVHLWRAPQRSGKSGLLNQLVPLVNADVLVLTDADIMFEPDSIRLLANRFADGQVGGVGGVTLQRQSGNEAAEETAYRRFEIMQKTSEALLHSTISAFGPFYAIRKSLFVPFHPHTYSNDDVMMPMNIIRQGYRMFFEPLAVSYEEALPEVKLEFKRRVRIGAGNYQAFFWLLDFLDPRKGWPWFCYVSHKVSRWFSPLFLITGAAACAVLALHDAGIIYRMVFTTGMVVTAASLMHRLIPLPFTRNFFYFLAMNTALVFGFFRFLGGIRSAVWTRTEHPG
ncbi:MAG: glycosyltransferase family 2 protein, partial [Chitinispirillaceae bacterium]|nr:glycosyltransferase family 2 protein [Chitinispirillaceae bacterium]